MRAEKMAPYMEISGPGRSPFHRMARARYRATHPMVFKIVMPDGTVVGCVGARVIVVDIDNRRRTSC